VLHGRGGDEERLELLGGVVAGGACALHHEFGLLDDLGACVVSEEGVSDPGDDGEADSNERDDNEVEFKKQLQWCLLRVGEELGDSIDDQHGAVVVRGGAFAEAVERGEDGLDRVGGTEVSLEFGESEFDAVTVLGFGDAIAEQDEAGAWRHVGGDVVEGGVGQEANGDIAIEDRLDCAVFTDEEWLDVAAVYEGDGSVGLVVDRCHGNVLAAGDAGAEERVDGV